MGDPLARDGYWVAWDDDFYFVCRGERAYAIKLPKDYIVNVRRHARVLEDGRTAMVWEFETKAGYRVIVEADGYRLERGVSGRG